MTALRASVLVDAAALAEACASEFVELAGAAVRERGQFRVALAGGNTPRATYARLARPDLGAHIPWGRVQILFGDERCVPPDDPASNYRMAREAWLDAAGAPSTSVRRVRGELAPEAAVADYAAVVGTAPLDLVLLGIGSDGHTASLFPGGPELDSTARVVRTTSPVAPHDRVSLGLAAIAEARAVRFLVAGAGKAAVLAEIARQVASGAPDLPAARVAASSPHCSWWLDRAAAADLPGDPT